MSTATSKIQAQVSMTSHPETGRSPHTIGDLIYNFKYNFLRNEPEIVPGLTVNQYEIIKRAYFYIHGQFESGPYDDNGNPKYFHELMIDRNDQSTKNIDVDTKDAYIKAETEGAQLKTWMLRREFVGYAKTSGFGKKLNNLSSDLPDMGTVVWKKIKLSDGSIDIEQTELINLMNDPLVDELKNGIVIERHLLQQYQMKEKGSAWNQGAVDRLIANGHSVARKQFLDENQTTAVSTVVDEFTPYYELYEFWGEVPKSLYEQCKTEGRSDKILKRLKEREQKQLIGELNLDISKPDQVLAAVDGAEKIVESIANTNETVYVMAIVGGIEDGAREEVLFCQEADRDLFPYKEVHYRRRKGRWLGLSNYELCFDLIEQANELTNRFFSSLRIALTHLYQTKQKMHVKNILTDLLEGDVVVTKSSIEAIPTEVRGLNEYKTKLDQIERKADSLTNAFEVVTGESLPSGTPFKLGNQQLQSANKLFKFIRQNISLFIEDVFNEWLLPSFARSLTPEHILDLIDDADDLDIYYNHRKKVLQYETIKQFILETNELPAPEQIQLVGALAKDQIMKGPKQIKAMANYYADQKYSLKMVIDGENETKRENIETLSTTFQTLAANPQSLQDPRLMRILNMLLEQTGFSPLELNTVNQTPTNPALNPANQGGGGAEQVQAAAQAGAPVPTPVAA